MKIQKSSLFSLPAILFSFCSLSVLSASEATAPQHSRPLASAWQHLLDGDYAKAKDTLHPEHQAQTPQSLTQQKVLLATLLAEEGRYQDAINEQLHALSHGAWTPWMAVLLADLDNLLGYAQPAQLVKLTKSLEARLQADQATWIESSLCQTLLVRLYCFQHQSEKAESMLNQELFLTQWMVLGPLDNRNGYGFLNESPPVATSRTSAPADSGDNGTSPAYAGRGRTIRWQEVSKLPWLGKVNLSSRIYPGEETYYYAATELTAETEAPATLAFACSGAVKIWWNDTPLLHDEQYHDFNRMQYLLPVTTRKGSNRLLIKIASDESMPASFSARLLPVSLNTLDQPSSGKLVHTKHAMVRNSLPRLPALLTWAPLVPNNEEDAIALTSGDASNDEDNSSENEPVEDALPPADAGLDWGALAFFRNNLSGENIPAPLAQATLGYLYLSYQLDSGTLERSRPLLEAASDSAPACPMILALASSVQPDENKARALLKQATEACPTAISAREQYLDMLEENAPWPQAETLAQEILKKQPASASAHATLAGIEYIHDREAEALLHLNKARASQPLDVNLLFRLRDLLADEPELYFKQIETAYTQIMTEELAYEWASQLEERLRFDDARDAYLAQQHITPDTPAIYLRLAKILQRQDKQLDALALLETALSWAPQHPTLLEEKGRILIRMGETEKGLACLKNALSMDSNQPDLRAYLRALEPAQNAFYAPFDIPFDTFEGRDAKPEDYPRFHTLNLLDQCVVYVHPNGTSRRMTHWAQKVLRKSGVRSASYYTISFDNERQIVDVLLARVIQPDGTIIPAPAPTDRQRSGEMGDGIYSSYSVKVIRFPQVRVGSMIELQYTIRDSETQLHHDRFEDAFFFGNMSPTVRFDYVADIPENVSLNIGQAGDTQPPQTTHPAPGRKRIRWERRNLAGIEADPAMPPYAELVPSLALSTFKDWNEVGRWYWDMCREAMTLPDDIVNEVQALTSKATTRAEKIAAIYQFVTREIRYIGIELGQYGQKPHKAERTYRTRYGDCKDTAVLMCAMLKAVGIESNVALVRTYNRGKDPSGTPCTRIFNHAITHVPAADGEDAVWLDGTTDFFPFGMLPDMDHGAQALLCSPDGGTLTTIPAHTADDNLLRQTTRLHLKPGGDATGSTRIDARGTGAPSIKRTLEAPERFRITCARLVATLFPGSLIIAQQQDERDGVYPDSWFSLDLELRRLAQPDNGHMRLQPWLLPFTLSRRYPLENKRIHDMMLGSPWTFVSTLELTLPEGASVVQTPEPQNITHPFGAFERKCTANGLTVRIETRLSMKARRLPAADYESFKEFCTTVDAALEDSLLYRDGKAREPAPQKEIPVETWEHESPAE